MSKKMLKRSLALGALMAFVITGQAWAENISGKYVENSNGVATTISNIDTTLSAKENDRLDGLRVQDGILNVTGDVKLSLTGEGENSYILGINSTATGDWKTHNNNQPSSITIGGKTDIDIVSNYERIFGIQNNYNVNIASEIASKIDFEDAVDINISNTSNYIGKFMEGLYAHYSETNFEKDASIYVENNRIGYSNNTGFSEDRIIALNGDAEKTVVNFKGNTTLKYVNNANFEGAVNGITASGYGYVNFTGNEATIDINAGNVKGGADGLSVQYSGKISSALNNELKILVNGKSINAIRGVAASEYSGTTGGIDLKGSTVVEATNNGNGDAYGVYGEAGADIDLADTTITATSNGGDAYGVGAYTGSDVTVTGTATVNAESSLGKARALDLKDASMSFEDNVVLNATADKAAIAIRAEKTNSYDGDVSVSIGGVTQITATSTGTGNAYGFLGKDGADLSLADTTITATSEGGRADGIYLENCKEMNVAGTLNITAVGNGVHENAGAQGIRLAYTSATFADDVEIHVTSNQEGVYAYGLNILSDTDFPLSNAVFKDNVTIDVEGGNVFSVLSSGSHPAGVTFEKGDVSIEATADGDYAFGIAAAYNSSVKANAETNIKITATAENGSAQAVNNTLTAGSNGVWYGNGKIELLGNVELIAKGKDADNSLAIYNEYYDGYGNGTTVVGSEGKKVVIDGNILTECGSVTVTFGKEGSQFDGKVTTVDNGATNDKYTKGTTTLNFAKGATWNLKGASTLTNATFAEGSVLNLVDGNLYDSINNPEAVYALNAVGDSTKLVVDEGAKLQIGDIKETTYNIATGFASYEVADSIDIADNALLQANKILDVDNKTYQVKVEAKKADQMAADTGISESTAGLVETIIQNANTDAAKVDGSPEQAAVEFIQNVMNENGSDNAAVGNAINAATKMGEAGGNSATAASIVKNVTGVTNDRLSFNCGHSAPHKGGHGVGLFEEGSGADIWVEYVHGKDEVEDMPSTAGATSYEGQYNGFVMGVDFKKVNKFQSGVAFNYGEGDTNSLGSSVRTHSDYDFWGVGYYGNIHNDDSNVIFDINYAKTDSDVTQYNSGSTLEASPETTTWSAGVKLEKLYQNENVQIVPYTGLRYMSIDADDYSTSGGEFYYSMDRQDIWLLPLGVSIRQEVANDNGWTVSPRVDLSYIWAFGDTNSNMEVKSPFPGVSQIGYDVMDDGSFLGLVGIEAHKGQWGYGVAYSYQKGDHSESKKWYVDVNYSF